MAVHSELAKHLTSKRFVWVDNSVNATIAAANATMDAQALQELERAAQASGYAVTLSAGSVVLVPR